MSCSCENKAELHGIMVTKEPFLTASITPQKTLIGYINVDSESIYNEIMCDEPCEVELYGVMSTEEPNLIGVITPPETLIGYIHDNKGTYLESVYDESYVVTPKVVAQTLHTENKLMQNDVTVLEIPYFEVDNTANGQTVIIGGD